MRSPADAGELASLLSVSRVTIFSTGKSWSHCGRSKLSYKERVLLDSFYVDNLSPILDLRIIVKTVPVVLFGDGAV